MRPKTNRLLMLLVGVVISGCASQTDRSSSGGGAQNRSQPDQESVQFINRPLDESPRPRPAPAPVTRPTEAAADFPVTTYELPQDQPEGEVEDIGLQEDESVSSEQAAGLASEDSVGDTTEFDDGQDEAEVEDLGTQTDASVYIVQAPVSPTSSLAGTTEYDGEEEEQAPVEDLGTQPDESGKLSYPENKRASTGSVVGSTQFLTLSAEAEPLFSFDKASLRSDQHAKLDELISSLSGTKIDSISIVGHADRIGKDAYNQKLSERRAAAVKAYLVKKGIPSRKIQAEGRGESEPVTGDICGKTRGKALISCLQPDRRVEVKVEATKISN